MLGKLEELTMLAATRAGPKALASSIFERVSAGQPKTSFGAVYTTIERLTKKGFLEECARSDQSGRQRRGFTITGSGSEALIEAINASAKIGGYSLTGGIYALS